MNNINYHINELNDKELVTLYKSTSDLQYIGTVYKRYIHLVFGMCLFYFKDKGIAINCTIQIFKKLADEIKYREVANFRTWLTSFVRSFCMLEIQEIHKRTVQEQ